jgi:hypothetical protein
VSLPDAGFEQIASVLIPLGTPANPLGRRFSVDFGPSLAAGTYELEFNDGSASPRSTFVLDNLSVTAVPEPGTWALMLGGLGVVGWMARRRARVAGPTAMPSIG